MKSWNPVLNLVKEIKEKILAPGYGITFSYTDNETCIERWVRVLDDERINKLTSPLVFHQHNEFVLITYGILSELRSGDPNVDVWDIHDGFYRECRSVVIDVVHEQLVCTPFKKFRNLNEGVENQINNVRNEIINATCIEYSDKKDGSMISASNYHGRLIVSSRQRVMSQSWRVEYSMNAILSSLNYVDMLNMYPSYTFIFEMIHGDDKHVVKYSSDEYGLYLIGCRNNETGEELSYHDTIDIGNMFGVKTTELMSTSLDDILNNLDAKKSFEAEGFVMSIDGHRIKIKYNDYLDMFKICGQLDSAKPIINSIINNTYDDLISRVPEQYKIKCSEIFDKVCDYIHGAENIINNAYNDAPKESISEYMKYIQSTVPKQFQGYCASKYNHQPYNLLQSKSGVNIKLSFIDEMLTEWNMISPYQLHKKEKE